MSSASFTSVTFRLKVKDLAQPCQFRDLNTQPSELLHGLPDG